MKSILCIMKLSFSTLGCPEWSIDDIVANAVGFGFSGVGIRGIGGEMDFARMPAFSPAERGLTRRKFERAGLDVYILLSSARFSSPAAIAELLRVIEIPLPLSSFESRHPLELKSAAWTTLDALWRKDE